MTWMHKRVLKIISTMPIVSVTDLFHVSGYVMRTIFPSKAKLIINIRGSPVNILIIVMGKRRAPFSNNLLISSFDILQSNRYNLK